MTKKINNIAKNTSYLTFALIIQKVISFTYFALLARNLGPDNLGKYYFAISFTAIISIFIDIGLTNVLTREVAKNNKDASNLLGTVVAIKIPLAFFSILFAFIVINFMNYDILTRQLVYLSIICMVLDSFTATFFAVSRGFHNLIYESIASVVFQIIVMVVGLFAIYSGKSLCYVMMALVLASIFNFIFSSIIVNKKIKVKIKLLYDFRLIKTMLKISIPFALFGIFQKIYMYLDSVLLSILAGNKYVGYYQVAFKIIFALQILPMAFVASLYPAMSDYWINNKKQLSISFERAINYLIIISLPITIGTVAIADKIVLVFKNQFQASILPMQIIMFSLMFIFINFPIGSLLNACDKQKQNTINMGVVVVFSIILNLILIPRFNAIGASITVLVTNILMSVLGFFYAWKIIKYNYKKIIIVFLKSLTSAGLMGAIAFYLKVYLNIFVVIFIAGMVYFFLLFVLKAYTKDDILSIRSIFISTESK